MEKKKVLFGTDSYFQLMTAINLRTTVYKDWYADIIVYGSVPSADKIADRLRETNVFDHVYMADTSLTRCGKKYSKREKLPKYFVYLYSLIAPSHVLKNAIGAKLTIPYDEFVKLFKNAIDFDSFAEVGMWLEKRGHQNKFYDNTTRDIIDETLKNIENFNQRLYINEGRIGDEITQRLKSLQTANEMEENLFDLPTEVDLDEYDNAGFAEDEADDFKVEADDE